MLEVGEIFFFFKKKNWEGEGEKGMKYRKQFQALLVQAIRRRIDGRRNRSLAPARGRACGAC